MQPDFAEAQMQSARSSLGHRENIPLTIVGGAPGTGKTSLVRHLLEHAAGRRAAAIVSESVEIDQSLVAESDGWRVVLNNGCAYVRADDDGTAALAALSASRERPEHVIIDRAGFADLRRMTGYGYMPGYSLNGAVLVVDASNPALYDMDGTDESHLQEQATIANVVLLNKVDRIDADRAAAAQRTLERLAPATRVVWSDHGRIAPPLLLGLRVVPGGRRADRRPGVPRVGAATHRTRHEWTWNGVPPRRTAASPRLSLSRTAMAARPRGVVGRRPASDTRVARRRRQWGRGRRRGRGAAARREGGTGRRCLRSAGSRRCSMNDEAPIGNSPTTASATNGGGLRVLLVDDHVESVVSVGRLLRSQGYQVRAALSGIEAVSAAVDFLPDVALIDLSLPLLDGFAVARKLRSMSSTRATFLIALTGWDSEDIVARARSAGFDRHVVKPVSFDAMRAVLSEAHAGAATLG
jgi:G3E family GTPase/CheY-like chemotaxis protein